MLELVIIGSVVLFVVLVLWYLNKESRNVILTTSSNVGIMGTTTLFKGSKETFKVIRSASRATAALIEENSDSIIVGLDEFNQAVAEERGAVRYTLKRINKFGEETGLDKVNGIFIDSAKEAKARMEEKRAKAKEAKVQSSNEPKEDKDIKASEEDMNKVLKEAGIDIDIARLRANGLSDEDIIAFVESNKKVVKAVRSATTTK